MWKESNSFLRDDGQDKTDTQRANDWADLTAAVAVISFLVVFFVFPIDLLARLAVCCLQVSTCTCNVYVM